MSIATEPFKENTDDDQSSVVTHTEKLPSGQVLRNFHFCTEYSIFSHFLTIPVVHSGICLKLVNPVNKLTCSHGYFA